MKGVLLATLMACVATLAVELPECPTDVEDPDVPVYLPYPDDCTLFIGCSHGEDVILTCPEGLHFNAATSMCDWPEDAGCQAAPSTEAPEATPPMETAPPTENPRPSECPMPGDVNDLVWLPHETSCNKFWACRADGTKGLYSCSVGQAFSKELRKCVDIWEAKCTRS